MLNSSPQLRRTHFVAFYLLSFLLLGLLPLLALVFNDGSMDFSTAAAAASSATGIPWTSNILNVLRLSMEQPVLLLSLVGSMAPALAAIVVLVYCRNSALWSAFRSRLRPSNHCTLTRALALYAAMFLLIVPCLLLVYEVRVWLGGDYAQGVAMTWALLPAILSIALLDQGALLEEIGWRGFAGPELQKYLGNPLVAATIIGFGWGLWHLPRDITTGVVERLGLIEYLSLFLPSFILGTVSVSIIACFFMNMLGGSLLAAIIVHGLTNDAIGISGSATITEALTPFHQITKSVPFTLLAAAIIGIYGSNLGKQQHE